MKGAVACGMRVQYTLHALAAKRKSVLCGRRRASERQSAVSTKAGKLGLHSCTTATGTSGGGARGRDGRELQRRTDETLTKLIQAVVGQDRLDPAEALPPLRRVLVENLSSTRIRKPSSGVSLQFQQPLECSVFRPGSFQGESFPLKSYLLWVP